MDISFFSTNTRISDYENGSSIFFDSVTEVVQKIIEEHYIHKYPKTAFLCTPCYPHFSFRENMISKSMLSKYDYIIFLNFDHFAVAGYKELVFNWITEVGVDEIWEWQIGMLKEYPENIKPLLKFMPVRYVTYYEPYAITQKDIRYIFAFPGNTCGRRQDIINTYSSWYIPYKIINGISYAPNAQEFEHCVCVLNIHGEVGNHQEQLRICELLCLNVPIVSEVSDINYFGELVTEIPTDQITKLHYLLINEEINIYTNPAAAYKELTYTDDAFEKYRISLLLNNPH